MNKTCRITLDNQTISRQHPVMCIVQKLLHIMDEGKQHGAATIHIRDGIPWMCEWTEKERFDLHKTKKLQFD